MKVNFKLNTLFIFFSLIFLSSFKKAPFLINSEENIPVLIVNSIEKKLPDYIEILYYGFKVLNAKEDVEKKLNEKLYNRFKELLANKSKNFTLIFVNEIDFKSLNINPDFIETQSLEEMCAFGKLIDVNAVVYGTVTILDEKRKVWDKIKKKKVEKKIALMQGNFFSVETGIPILRFLYYFYIDE